MDSSLKNGVYTPEKPSDPAYAMKGQHPQYGPHEAEAQKSRQELLDGLNKMLNYPQMQTLTPEEKSGLMKAWGFKTLEEAHNTRTQLEKELMDSRAEATPSSWAANRGLNMFSGIIGGGSPKPETK